VLYDKCLAEADSVKEKDPGLIKRDYSAYQKAYAAAFSPFPKRLNDLLDQQLVYGRFSPTAKGLAAAKSGIIQDADLSSLLKQGYVHAEGLRYEDFLPISAAGIFASNLGQYGTKSTAAQKPVYRQEQLEAIMGRKIVDSHQTYKGLEAQSILDSYYRLGLLEKLSREKRHGWQEAVLKFNPGL
jgi:uncharacterized glyoxalase superfamily metalloenzyme YdcJ